MPKKSGIPKQATSVRLTRAAVSLWQQLAEKSGVTKAAWMETILRREAKKAGIVAVGDGDGAGD